jgi:hypothetical protein
MLYLIISTSCLNGLYVVLHQKQQFCKVNGIETTVLYERRGASGGSLSTAQSWLPIGGLTRSFLGTGARAHITIRSGPGSY